MLITWYVTSHGYGHAIRSVTVMEALLRDFPGVSLDVRTAAPDFLFHSLPSNRFKKTPVTLDCGTIDTPDWEVDIAATLEVVGKCFEFREERLASEVDALRRIRPQAVVFDVPWLTPIIAWECGVPSIAIANFTWDQIYREFAPMGEHRALVDRIEQDYSATTLGLVTPLGADLPAFPRRERIPLIARKATSPRDAIRRELGLAEGERAVLVALRGDGAEARAIDWPEGWVTVSFLPGNAHHRQLPPQWKDRFPDLVAAADLVFTKPGYGIASECIANQTPMLYLPRKGFAETPHLLHDLHTMGFAEEVDFNEDDSMGLKQRLQELVSKADTLPWPKVETHGAEVAAKRIVETAL